MVLGKDYITPDPRGNNLYSADLGHKSLVTIGQRGNSERFKPNINSQIDRSVNDEFYFNINPEDVVPNASSFFRDFGNGTFETETNHRIDRYYVDDLGQLEYEIEFAEFMCPNSIELKLKNSNNLRFCHQGELSEAELLEGFFRPENIINSYAVYCNKKNNIYQTSKVAHIPRSVIYVKNHPSIRAWCTQTIEQNNRWEIVIPELFLELYGSQVLVIGPTLGYTTAGASTFNPFGNLRSGPEDLTDGTGGTLDSFHVAVSQIDGTDPEIKLGMYPSVSENWDNQTLVEYVEGVASVTDNLTINALGTTNLSANSAYALGATVKGSDTKIKYDNGTDGHSRVKSGVVYANEFTNPSGIYAAGSDSRSWSIWATYSSGGATGNPWYYYAQLA